MISLTQDDQLWVLDLGDADNRFDGDTVPAIRAALEQVAAAESPAALLTVASGKVWHNGLDLDHVGSLGRGFVDFVGDVQELFALLLELPVPTVAAVSGHAFAGGAMLALAHDIRVMRSDRGFFCLPEVDLGMPFTVGMSALISAKLSQPAMHRAGVLGERMPGSAALELGVVDALADEADVRSDAAERASGLVAKAGPTIAGLRSGFYQSAIDALRTRTFPDTNKQ